MGVQTSVNRIKFTQMVNLLCDFMRLHGYQPALDWVKREPGCPHYMKGTYHEYGLAVDIHLYKDGHYFSGTQDHALFGQFWEFIGGTWGGAWDDGNHYSYLEGRQ